MAAFSPSLMAKLEKAPIAFAGYGGTLETRNAFVFKGSFSSFLAFMREAQNDNSPGSSQGFEHYRDLRASWAGFSKASPLAMLDSGFSPDALEAFNTANARIESKGIPASPEYRVCGGVWSVPRHLSGHPLSAVVRPRTKLPAKNWDIAACFMWTIEAKDVAAPLAKIARAAWAYIQQGGAVTLTIHYSAKFSRDFQGCSHIVTSLTIPLSNPAAIATACSVQFFRSAFIAFGQALSGTADDNLPVAWLHKPGIVRIQGKAREDAKALEALGIK